MSGEFETYLNPNEEIAFMNWFQNAKRAGVVYSEDSGQDYDFRGYWKDMVAGEKGLGIHSAETHFPDTYKKPNHPTFSTDSIYAQGEYAQYAQYAGTWSGDTFNPPAVRYGGNNGLVE